MTFDPGKIYEEICDIIKDLAASCEEGKVMGGGVTKKEVIEESGNIRIGIEVVVKP